jgi:23S rRNA A1618 N6-methylase RlmF
VGCFPPIIFGVIFLTICSSMTTEAVLGMVPPSQIPLCKAAADSSSLPSHKRGATEAMLEPESAEFPLLLHKRPNVAGPSCTTHDDAVPWPASPGEEQQPLPGKKGSGAAQHRAKGAFNSRAGGSSFDERMHPRNRYFRHRPDFAALAAQFGDFAALTTTDSKGRVHVDWKDAAASAALTRALLCADYGLQWELPRGFLCPPVPQRANYIHWIEDLLAGPIETAVKPASAVSIPAVATGLDIGVGASGIYPLLALSLHPAWKMIGTEINPEALASARANVERNGLCPKIDLRLVSTDGGVLVDAINDQDGVIDFCMCNPPFFAAEDDAHKASHYRASEANLLELVTPGGERAFVHRIIADSKTLQGRVRWYTTMVRMRRMLTYAGVC